MTTRSHGLSRPVESRRWPVFLLTLVSVGDLGAQGLLLSDSELKPTVAVSPYSMAFGGDKPKLKTPCSHRDSVPVPKDQGEDDSCVAWTIGYGLLSFLNEKPNEPLKPY